MSLSPFDAALGAHAAELPGVLREQLLEGDVVLEGVMDVVWHRPRFVRPLLAVLARCDLLFPETGRAVPASLVISSVAEGHAWRRTFAFRTERRFNALVVYDIRSDSIVERMDRLDLRWVVRFEPPDAVLIRTGGGTLRIGSFVLPLPRLLLPDVVAIEVAQGPDSLWVAVTAAHPLLGPFFGYSGSFRLRREGARAA